MPFVKDGKESLMFSDRVDQAVSWLKSCKNLTFEALYFEEPDKTTHDHGADSNKTKIKNLFKTALSKIDLMVGRLISKLNESDLLNETNIILIGEYVEFLQLVVSRASRSPRNLLPTSFGRANFAD